MSEDLPKLSSRLTDKRIKRFKPRFPVLALEEQTNPVQSPVAALHVWALHLGFLAPHLLSSPQGLGAAGLWSFKFPRFRPPGVQRFTAGPFQVFTGVHHFYSAAPSLLPASFSLRNRRQEFISHFGPCHCLGENDGSSGAGRH